MFFSDRDGEDGAGGPRNSAASTQQSSSAHAHTHTHARKQTLQTLRTSFNFHANDTFYSPFTRGETQLVLSRCARLTGTDQINVALRVSVAVAELTSPPPSDRLRRQDFKKRLSSDKDVCAISDLCFVVSS